MEKQKQALTFCFPCLNVFSPLVGRAEFFKVISPVVMCVSYQTMQILYEDKELRRTVSALFACLPLSEQLEAELAAEDAVAPAVAGEETHGKHSGREAVAHLDIGMDMMSLKR